MTTLPRGHILHGSYKIESILGQGGFAVTYAARHTRSGARHAVKEYFPIGVAERSGAAVRPAKSEASRGTFTRGLDSFLEEAQTIAKFSHPNIVAIQDYFQENGTAYLVMPYLVGETLDMVLKKCPGSKMSAQAMKEWLGPLLNGLATLHKNNYLHRDLKPSNIYLTGNATPILIDFGAARSTLGQLARDASIVLTPQYAPPEQYTTNASSQGPWTDIYALGAIMYRCLLGTPPPNSNDRQLAVIQGEKDPVELAYTDLVAASNLTIANAITLCLDLNSKSRVRSVSELQNLLSGKSASTAEGSRAREKSAGRKGEEPKGEKGKFNLLTLFLLLAIIATCVFLVRTCTTQSAWRSSSLSSAPKAAFNERGSYAGTLNSAATEQEARAYENNRDYKNALRLYEKALHEGSQTPYALEKAIDRMKKKILRAALD